MTYEYQDPIKSIPRRKMKDGQQECHETKRKERKTRRRLTKQGREERRFEHSDEEPENIHLSSVLGASLSEREQPL